MSWSIHIDANKNRYIEIDRICSFVKCSRARETVFTNVLPSTLPFNEFPRWFSLKQSAVAARARVVRGGEVPCAYIRLLLHARVYRRVSASGNAFTRVSRRCRARQRQRLLALLIYMFRSQLPESERISPTYVRDSTLRDAGTRLRHLSGAKCQRSCTAPQPRDQDMHVAKTVWRGETSFSLVKFVRRIFSRSILACDIFY